MIIILYIKKNLQKNHQYKILKILVIILYEINYDFRLLVDLYFSLFEQIHFNRIFRSLTEKQDF